jgi:hypothetical protein
MSFVEISTHLTNNMETCYRNNVDQGCDDGNLCVAQSTLSQERLIHS